MEEAAALEKPLLEQAPNRSCGHGVELTQEQVFHQKLQRMGQPIPENCALCEEPTLKQFLKNCLLWVGLHTAAREEHMEEGVPETKCYGQTATHIPCSPV